MKNTEIKPSRKVFISNYPHFRYWKKHPAEDMLAQEPINIYVHVPFCMQKCAYCYYKTERLKNREQLDRYTDAVCREIKWAGERFDFKRRHVKSIYIGGGTPSILPEAMLKKVIDCLHENFNLENPEFTIEAEPRTLNNKKVSAYKQFGVTRISIGVQSFNDEIIKLSGRNHSGENALQAIERVKGIDGNIVVNIDLLSGLAGETDETWAGTVDMAIESGVHSITIYRMEVYLNTDVFKQSVRKKVVRLPSESQELEFMKLAVEKFESSNYKPWSFFTFTRGGEFPHQYAINIWKGEDCCAFGPSAFGKLGSYNYQNAGQLDNYLAMVKENKLPVIRAYKLTSKDLIIKDVLLGMKLHRLNRLEFAGKHGLDFCQVIPGTVEELRSEGFILLDDDYITLAPKGLLYGDYVGKRLAFALKEYLGMDKLSLY